MKPFPKSTGYRAPVAPDPRNFILEKAQPVAPFPVSYKTDLTALGVYDQYQIPDCVENGITLAKRYFDYKSNGVVTDLCRRFLAKYTVQLDGFPISQGTDVETALKVASNGSQGKGICESALFPDDHTLDETTFISGVPTAEAINNAKTHVISGYAFLSDKSFNGIKNAIYQNGVVILAVTLDKNWWTAPNGNVSWAMADILPLRIPTDAATKSGHVVVAYAYDSNYIYIWNSFSDQWGDQGHGWFGAEYCPYIGEAGTIVDFTPAQYAQITKADTIVNTIDQLQNVETPANKSLISSIISGLWISFLALFN